MTTAQCLAGGFRVPTKVKGLCVGLVLLTTAVLVATQLTPSEPKWSGRGLSAWLHDLAAPDIPTQTAAAKAIKQMGTNAVPGIIKHLKSHVSDWPQTLHGWRGKVNEVIMWANRQLGPRFGRLGLIGVQQNKRWEALAGLDALGTDASAALPTMKELISEIPPEPAALYIVARMGPAGSSIIQAASLSKEKLLRIEALVCLELARDKSPLLLGCGPDAGTYQERLNLFYAALLAESDKEWQTENASQGK